MKIAAIETRRYSVPWDPPLHVAWDPVPRTRQEATIVIVRSDEGLEGYASGDALPDRALLERFLVGIDPLRTRDRARALRDRRLPPRPAVDRGGRGLGPRRPRARHPLLGAARGRSERLLAYASSCERVDADERVRRCVALRDAGVRAVKLRFFREDWREDVAIAAAVRDAVGPDFQIMVDANQGWRMPGDLGPRWDLATAAQCARELEGLGVYWLEEPLRADDPEGYAALRRLTDLRIAAGEMCRTAAEARDLVVRGGVDVIQTDVVLSAGGISGCRRVAALAELHGRWWSPHTWSNGYGLVANLHLALAVSACPYVEVPYDPPGLPAARRDWLLPAAVEIDADGFIAPPAGPGLGVVPDFDALEQWRVG